MAFVLAAIFFPVALPLLAAAVSVVAHTITFALFFINTFLLRWCPLSVTGSLLFACSPFISLASCALHGSISFLPPDNDRRPAAAATTTTLAARDVALPTPTQPAAERASLLSFSPLPPSFDLRPAAASADIERGPTRAASLAAASPAAKLMVEAARGDDAAVGAAMIDQPELADESDALSGCTALHFAAEKGHLQCCAYLLEAGADVDAVDNLGRTPLHLASMNQFVMVALLLLSRGADREAKTASGWVPAEFARSEEMKLALLSYSFPFLAGS